MINSSKLAHELEKAGLSDKSSLIYAFLLENGGAFPSHIAKETGLNRSTVYKLLIDLSVKGLVNEIQKGKKLYYQIEKPRKLIRYAKKRLENAEDAYAHVKNMIPEIEGLYAFIPNKPKIKYFEGVDGLINAYSDHIAENEPYEMLGFANVDRLREFLPKKFFDNYRKTKERLGITTRGILPDTDSAQVFVSELYNSIKKDYWPVTRFVPAEKFPYECEITLYGKNKVSFINMKDGGLVAVIIEDDVISGMMRMIFELAYSSATS